MIAFVDRWGNNHKRYCNGLSINTDPEVLTKNEIQAGRVKCRAFADYTGCAGLWVGQVVLMSINLFQLILHSCGIGKVLKIFMIRKSSALLIVALLFSAALSAPAPAVERDRVDRAIDRALAFLKKTQESDGAWSGRTQKKRPAISSLAIMAFLSAGHVPGEGRYAALLDKGIRWVLKTQNRVGLFASDDNLDMYHHGISTLMLAEAAGMTDSKLGRELKPCLEKAVDVILKAQRNGGSNNPQKGGWRYLAHGNDADISVSGWQILALRAAKNLGCDVPAEKINLALDYVRRCQDPVSGGFGYTPGGLVSGPCTGTSILALELCGKEHHGREVLRGGSYLLKNPLNFGQQHFFYSVYYQSQAMFQLGKNYWNVFRPQLHKVLLEQQTRHGSWNADDGLGANYGTAMAVLALTVEYRFLPIYQREEPQEKRK